MLPVEIIQSQAAYLAIPEAIDGQQHQHRPGTDVVPLVTFGHGEQPAHIIP